MQTKKLNVKYDYLAPDGSEIRLLAGVNKGDMAHCILPSEKISKAVKHKTVEEIWFILEGQGEMWSKKGDKEEIVKLMPNLSLSIPVGTSFQFRNTGKSSLKIIITTMPPWPGANEAVSVNNYWDLK